MGPRHTRSVRIVSTAMGAQARACEAWVERDMELSFPSPLTGRARVEVRASGAHMLGSPPSQPFPTSATAEGRQLNGAPSPRLRRRRGHSLTCPLPQPGGKEQKLLG